MGAGDDFEKGWNRFWDDVGKGQRVIGTLNQSRDTGKQETKAQDNIYIDMGTSRPRTRKDEITDKVWSKTFLVIYVLGAVCAIIFDDPKERGGVLILWLVFGLVVSLVGATFISGLVGLFIAENTN